MVGFALTFIPTCLVCYVHCNEAEGGCQTFFNKYSLYMLTSLFLTKLIFLFLFIDKQYMLTTKKDRMYAVFRNSEVVIYYS